ncbi:MAG TPA: inositol monophosphatase family protein [Solirubrobacterales bacterium]|nr:inositol monophosphatase family protein [Solirubrobacterales bacterium]
MNQLPADPALDADWTGICRDIVGEQKKLFDEYETTEQRDNYDGVGEGGDHTLVLDRMCEDIVFAALEKLAENGGGAFTAISEERGTVEFNGGGSVWVVIDPIDGSLNFKRTIPRHSLSIAVATAPNMAAVEFGYVYDFGTDEEFLAQSGEGSYLNEKRLHLSAREGLEVVGVEGSDPVQLAPMLAKLAGKVYRVRCVGSLAISIASVAAGRFDGLAFPHLSRSVDVAAAQLIAREAGALVDLGEGGLSEVGLALEERFPVTVAATGEGLDTLVSTRGID